LSHEISNIAEAETVGTVEGNMGGIAYARCRRSAGVEGHITSERNASEPERSHVRPPAAEPERRAGAKENTNRCRTCRTQGRESVSQAPERAASRQHPRWEPYAGKPARTVLCGGRSVMGVPTAILPGCARLSEANLKSRGRNFFAHQAGSPGRRWCHSHRHCEPARTLRLRSEALPFFRRTWRG
jgi:hypothetical protein